MLARGRLAAAAGLVLLVAVAVLAPRLAGLRGLLLSEDELFHANMASEPFSFILRHGQLSPTYPAWYLPYKGWVALFGGSDLARKALSVLFGVAGALAAGALAWRIAGRHAGLLLIVLLGLSGYHVHYSQVATPYAFLCLLGALIPWTLLLAIERRSRAAAVLHALLLATAFYTHTSAFLLAGAELAALLLLVLARLRQRAGAATEGAKEAAAAAAGAAPAAGAAAASGAAHCSPCSPFSSIDLRLGLLSLGGGVLLAGGAFFLMLRQWQTLRGGGFPFIFEMDLAAIWDRIHDLLAYRSPLLWTAPLEAAAGLAAVGLGSLALVRILCRKAEGEWQILLLACLALLPFAVSVLAGLLIAKDLFYEARFFAVSLPALVVLIGVASARLAGVGAADAESSRLGRLAPIGAALAFAFVLAQVGSFSFLYGGGRAADNFPIARIAADLRREARPGDVAVVHHSWYLPFFERYYGAPHPRFLGAVTEGILDAPFGGVHLATRAEHVQELLARLEGHRRLFLVLSRAALQEWRDPDSLVERALDERYALLERACFSCSGGYAAVVKLYDLERPAAAPLPGRLGPAAADGPQP